MPVEITRIEVVVVEPPRFALETAGARRAVERCGDWPTVATIGTYLDAVDRARREADRLYEIELRYRRHYGIEAGGNARWRSRYGVTMALFEQRSECLRLLTVPEAGSA